MQRLALTTVAIGLALGLAASARAQTIPEGQSCGGLLCDMGIFGHKVPPSASATPAPVAAVATTAMAPASAPAAQPTRHVRRQVARTSAGRRHAPKTAGTTTAAKTTIIPRAAGPQLATAPVSAPQPAAPVAATPTRAVAAPAYQRPLIFQSIDPMLQ